MKLIFGSSKWSLTPIYDDAFARRKNIWSQFHQHFTCAILYKILVPKITKLYFGFDIFGAKNLYDKCERKMLMKLNEGRQLKVRSYSSNLNVPKIKNNFESSETWQVFNDFGLVFL